MGRLLARILTAVLVVALFTPVVQAANLFGPPGLDTTYGIQVRVRNELMENNFDLNTAGTADRDFFRLRTLAFVKLDYEKKYDLMVRFCNEMKLYTDLAGATYRNRDHYYDPDELLIDNLFVSAYNLFGLPFDIRVGRQDIMEGDGFLIMDGTAGDGSRTGFFNAVKGTVKFSKDNSLDLIYIDNPKTDMTLTWLYDSINGRKVLNSSNETGFVAYLHSKPCTNLLLEPYFIYKREDSFGSVKGLDLNTYGARVVWNYAPYTFKAEFALQDGNYDLNGVSRRGFGGHTELKRTFDNLTFKPEVELTFVTLSGDDRSTPGKVEAFDPLFCNWPIWSELYVFTLMAETGSFSSQPAYWTNLQIYKASTKLNFTPATNFLIAYNYMRANELTNISSAMFSNNSKDRGHLLQGKIYHKFNKNLDGYFLMEYFIPGDFYGPTADKALFARAQLNCTY